jgi:hypothetical protein
MSNSNSSSPNSGNTPVGCRFHAGQKVRSGFIEYESDIVRTVLKVEKREKWEYGSGYLVWVDKGINGMEHSCDADWITEA